MRFAATASLTQQNRSVIWTVDFGYDKSPESGCIETRSKILDLPCIIGQLNTKHFCQHLIDFKLMLEVGHMESDLFKEFLVLRLRRTCWTVDPWWVCPKMLRTLQLIIHIYIYVKYRYWYRYIRKSWLLIIIRGNSEYLILRQIHVPFLFALFLIKKVAHTCYQQRSYDRIGVVAHICLYMLHDSHHI